MITNNHVLGKTDLENDNYIEFSINNEKEYRKIHINKKNRIIFTNETLDSTIIEIKPSKDNINTFLDLDETINKDYNLLEKIYKKKSVYLLHYPKGNIIEVSYGQITSLTDSIYHLCITDKGSSGSPILSLDSFKVIGIHNQASHFKFNKGIFIKNALNAFYDENKDMFYKSIKQKKIKNEMTINYNVRDYDYIRIFSKKFVDNNKNNCKMVINGKEEMGICEYINKNDLQTNSKSLEIKIKEIKTIYDMSYMFFECRRLTFISSNWNTHNVTNMSYMFSSCLSLKYLYDIMNWNTSNVTNMKGMFELCISLASLPDISNWDTSNVQDMSFMFNKCSSLISLPDISKWNLSKVTDLSWIFKECSSLKSFPEISKWNISNVTNMSFMFNKCSSLKSLPDISQWDTSKVSNMSNMFSGCSSLKSLPNISVWNTNNVTCMTSMFNECKKLKDIPKKFSEQTSNNNY